MNKKLVLFLLIAVIITACGSKKKKSMAGDEEVSFADFIDAYTALQLPFTFKDSSFPKNENDSLLISSDVFYRFVADTAIKKVFGLKAKPKFYTVGRFSDENDTYLLTKAITSDKKSLFVTAFNKEEKYIASAAFITVSKSLSTAQQLIIDKKFNFSKEVSKKNADGSFTKGHDAYILNSAAKTFMLVMTDSMGEGIVELVNPIDTLPRLQKYSADYGDGRDNLISIRDGQRSGKLLFFIHLDKNGGDCTGELKGEAVLIAPDTAEYRQGGDPCVLQFAFSNNAVRLKEVEGCGSRLGALQCSFDGSYTKRKYKKPENSAIIPKKKK